MDYLPMALALTAVAIVVYYYITRDQDLFKKHGIPHIPPKPLVGNLGSLITRQTSMWELLHTVCNINTEAKYVGFYEFLNPIVLIRDLDLIKSITVKNFDHFQDHRAFINKRVDPMIGRMLFFMNGDHWKEQKNMLSPVFTSSKLKQMFNLMSTCTKRFVDHVVNLPEKERDGHIKDLLRKYGSDIIASCVYGVSVDSMKDPENPFYLNGSKGTTFDSFTTSLKTLTHRNAPTLATIFNLKHVPKQTSDFFLNVVKEAVRDRKENGTATEQRTDMLQMLMDIRDKRGAEQALTPESMALHTYVFYFGGLDSMSRQTSFVTRMLAEHPDVQERLQQEIDETLNECNGELSYDVINNMKYLDAVINETMRMYPTGLILDRLCVKDFELPPALPGAKPFTIRKGTYIFIPIAPLQMNPKYYKNPEKFDPERFVTGGKEILASGAFMPFGTGPRVCIGMRFALMEMKILLCYLLARCDIKIGSKTEVPLKMAKGRILVVIPTDSFWLKIEVRKNPHPLMQVNREANVGVDSN